MVFYLQGTRLLYTPWAIIPSENSRLSHGFFFITPSKRSVPPFWFYIYGTEGSILIPRYLEYSVTCSFYITILLLYLSTVGVTRGVPRVGNSAWLNAMQQRRHWRQRCRWLKVSVAIYLNNTQGSVYVAWRKERSFPRSFRRRTPICVLKVSLTNLKGLMTVDVCVTCNSRRYLLLSINFYKKILEF